MISVTILSLLTYRGGHSINEAYSVFDYQDSKPFQLVDYITLLEKNEYTKNIINELNISHCKKQIKNINFICVKSLANHI